MSSINTNNSAMNALATLRGVNSNLNQTQDRISTGLKVSSGKDNAAYFAISETMKGESGMNKAVNESLTLAKNSVSTARLGAETVQDLAQQFVDRLAFAQNEGVDQESVQKELTALASEMKTALDQSGFNGQNLLTTATPARTEISFVSGVSRASDATLSLTSVTVNLTDLEALVGDPAANAADDSTFADIQITNASTTAELEASLSAAQGFLEDITAAATDLGIGEKSLENQQEFLTKLTDNLDTGVGAMVDANMEEEAARLQALQVQQQLASQSLSIANQAPQNILSLFR
ncbi:MULTISPECIES: flagellin N-terminal helical domain-containing protein [Sulfitobacter]|uniref:Flagellin n=1 Tax=Sulfitobacter dubius TaxID=218673 RepID=A0ABY3ZM32_9RHOB|nr:flagellin [Sulfitobacter dubius]UOA15739.1 Flagellin [Sulfitobacter dubius]WOI28871.1 flagellin [Sulfitobacter dubius]